MTGRRRILLAGMDFYGNPTENAPGWSEKNAVGLLWKRFGAYLEANRASVRNLVSDSGYELWVGEKGVTTEGNESIFVGVEVSSVDELPMELVAKMLPETRYAVFTLRGERTKTDWARIWSEWMPASGLTSSHDYLIEYYDRARFRGLESSESEVDFMVPAV